MGIPYRNKRDKVKFQDNCNLSYRFPEMSRIWNGLDTAVFNV